MSDALIELAKQSGAKGAAERMAAIETSTARFFVCRPDGKESRRLPVAILPSNPYEILEKLWQYAGKQHGTMAMMIVPGLDDGDAFGFPVEIPDLIDDEEEESPKGGLRDSIELLKEVAAISAILGGGKQTTLVDSLQEMKAAKELMDGLNGDAGTEEAIMKMAPDLLRIMAPEKTG